MADATPIDISRPLNAEQVAKLRTWRATSSNGNGSAAESPRAATPVDNGVEMPRNAAHYAAKDSIPNTPLAASLISAILGAIAGVALCCAARPIVQYLGASSWTWARPQLGIYVAAVAMFHLLEFWTTAGWNYQKLSVDAFLLNNTQQYHFAHAFGLTEYFISSYFWPSKFASPVASFPVLAIIVCVMIAGQSFRSLAMVHAAQSFSHIVKKVKLEDHTLVTDGVYSLSRHPSYAGFFYWALATQLLMSNVVSTVGFILVLYKFFSTRIRDEEKHLTRFFGQQYVDYSAKVGTGLPFSTS